MYIYLKAFKCSGIILSTIGVILYPFFGPMIYPNPTTAVTPVVIFFLLRDSFRFHSRYLWYKKGQCPHIKIVKVCFSLKYLFPSMHLLFGWSY